MRMHPVLLSILIGTAVFAQSTGFNGTTTVSEDPTMRPERALPQRPQESLETWIKRVGELPPLSVGRLILACGGYNAIHNQVSGALKPDTGAMEYLAGINTLFLKASPERVDSLCKSGRALAVQARFRVIKGLARPISFAAVGSFGEWPLSTRSAIESDPAKALSKDVFETEKEYAARVAKLPPYRVGQLRVDCDHYEIEGRKLPGEFQPESWASEYVKSDRACSLTLDREQAKLLCVGGHAIPVLSRFEVVDGKLRTLGLKVVTKDGEWPVRLIPPTAIGSRPGQAWTDPATGIALCWIPAGTLVMGSPASEDGRFLDEGPQHEVQIDQGFWMGTYEITQAQYEKEMGVNPSYFRTVGPSAPVEQVSWNDAQAFLAKLNAKGGIVAYRLPMEAQWEYACRARTTEPRYGDLDAIGWYDGNGETSTHAVGQKQANAWGLYDMLGNVWEWCQDGYGTYGSSQPGSGTPRVLRGGSWFDSTWDCRAANRYRFGPAIRYNFLGFRVVAAQKNQP